MYFNAILLTIHVFCSKIDTLFDAKGVLQSEIHFDLQKKYSDKKLYFAAKATAR